MPHSHETTGKENKDDGEGDGQAVGVLALLLPEAAAALFATHPTREENGTADKKADGNEKTQDHQDDDPRRPLDHLQQTWERASGNHGNWDHIAHKGKTVFAKHHHKGTLHGPPPPLKQKMGIFFARVQT